MTFLQTLREQRWDDHRYYHQSRINQTLHLISACSFLVAYALLFVDPAKAAIVGWCVSMVTRQSGHFFFEPRGYDQVNQVTDEYKEEVKVGYNMRRKSVLLAVWAAIPLVLWLQPSLFGLIEVSPLPSLFGRRAAATPRSAAHRRWPRPRPRGCPPPRAAHPPTRSRARAGGRGPDRRRGRRSRRVRH